ncbi:MAG: NTP transferase domain-containing protein [Candidatus Marinimicrobia bacterium]|nr:NTP transferase domain-containing protein [Candidatus Neomarinimicrobiota bacterium]MCF7828181.1 NTP transferase domain-containing protein [Candidatus Neomarinimicrobiota bacterium]MCF7879644.1 NTP transferase domain-containing protein [Candidatus Neomarinimicrobiota bacterium]
MPKQDVTEVIQQYNGELNPEAGATAIILAAGHGKRIKSQRSKMLHKIWGKATVERVSNAARKGLSGANVCIVVGIKAESVIKTVGKRDQQVFVYQEEQNGTGHAVQVALDAMPEFIQKQKIYVFPGDIGLLRDSTVKSFREDFRDSGKDMMVLTGRYEGDPAENYYGRIVRVPDDDQNKNAGNVIKIMESKDIQALDSDEPYPLEYDGKTYEFSRQELLEIPEFNTGVFAFNGVPLNENIANLDANNVQGELYITDLIGIFNRKGLSVGAVTALENRDVLGFNNKAVLKEMNSLYQQDVYNQLKNLVRFRDPDDFFINDETAEKLIQMDVNGTTLDLTIGKGVYINGKFEFGAGVELKDGAHITGNVEFGNNVTIHKGVELSTYPDQTLTIGDNTIIFQDNIVKGNTSIGSQCRIESGVNVTGSDRYPTRIGNRVMIKGTSYIFGSIIEENAWIEHCILKAKRVHCHYDRNGDVAPVRYVIPQPEGLDDVESIGDDREEYTWPPSN